MQANAAEQVAAQLRPVDGFLLEKLGAVVGVSNLHIYAAMRGQSLADFQQTRNAPGALYSVAGTTRDSANWTKPADGAA